MLRFLIFAIIFALVCASIASLFLRRHRHSLNLKLRCEELDDKMRKIEADTKFYEKENENIKKGIEILEIKNKEIEKRKKMLRDAKI